MTPPANEGIEREREGRGRKRRQSFWDMNSDQWKDQHTILLDNKILSSAGEFEMPVIMVGEQ